MQLQMHTIVKIFHGEKFHDGESWYSDINTGYVFSLVSRGRGDPYWKNCSPSGVLQVKVLANSIYKKLQLVQVPIAI